MFFNFSVQVYQVKWHWNPNLIEYNINLSHGLNFDKYYQAQVDTTNSKETYVGLTANSFKARYSGHKTSFTKKERKKETTLSKHIWALKEKNEAFNISWKILSRAQPFSQVTGLCQLCTREKYFIVFKQELGTLNSRNELLGSCRHKQTNLLSKQNQKNNNKKKKKARNR